MSERAVPPAQEHTSVASASAAPAHPLDGTDPDECYSVMMAERTTLITAKRESEDNLNKTIVQLSSAMIILAAGFISQNLGLITSRADKALFGSALLSLCVAIVSAVLEQRLSAKGYEKQIEEVTAFYTKERATFSVPKINWWIERSLNFALVCFILGLILVASFAMNKVLEQGNGTATPTLGP